MKCRLFLRATAQTPELQVGPRCAGSRCTRQCPPLCAVRERRRSSAKQTTKILSFRAKKIVREANDENSVIPSEEDRPRSEQRKFCHSGRRRSSAKRTTEILSSRAKKIVREANNGNSVIPGEEDRPRSERRKFCHPERRRSSAKRTIFAVEGPALLPALRNSRSLHAPG